MSTHLHQIFTSSGFFLKFIWICLSIDPSISISVVSFETNMIDLNCCELACYYKVYFWKWRCSQGKSLLCCRSIERKNWNLN